MAHIDQLPQRETDERDGQAAVAHADPPEGWAQTGARTECRTRPVVRNGLPSIRRGSNGSTFEPLRVQLGYFECGRTLPSFT